MDNNSLGNEAPESFSFVLDCGSRKLHLSDKTHVMGVLNVTPDSFFDGGKYFDPDRAFERALEIEQEGADLIDIGGESTRPGSDPVEISEEMRRVIPLIEKLKGKISIPISIDTKKSEVAEAALQAGASIVNDVSAFRADPEMISVVAKYNVPVVIMHMKGTPKTMQNNPTYEDIIGEIYRYLDETIQMAVERGISKNKIIIDPGIGFGKKWEDNFVILGCLKEFQNLMCPILVGVSRKSFIGWALDLPEEKRLMGTAGAVAASVMNGANIVRVHDVKEIVQVVRIVDRIKNNQRCYEY